MRSYLRISLLLMLSWSLAGCANFWDLVMTDEEKQLLRKSAQEAAACHLSQRVQAPMGHESLYTFEQGSCVAVPLRDEAWFGSDEKAPQRRFYTDIFCRQPVQYQLTRYYAFCEDYVFSERLGNDQSLESSQAWTLNPATRFRFPLVRQYGFEQPFMTTRVYHKVNVSLEQVFEPQPQVLHLRKGSGRCELQMRIFKEDPASTGGKSLLVFHGGGGYQRGFHSMALESRIPEFTEQGYTVYMPFYRMIGSDETVTECSDAQWADLKDDAEAALRWVEGHQQEFGDTFEQGKGKLSLMAQGSGALLAGWLVTRYPEVIDRSLMLYPLLDTASMRKEILQRGGFDDGRATLERLLNGSLEDLSESDPVLLETSFLDRISKAPEQYPPMMLLHGEQDQRIPKQQSIKACQAYSSGVDLALGEGMEKKRGSEIECGRSTLFLLSGAEYQLDYCLKGIECPAGDKQSRNEVLAALKRANHWLKHAGAKGDVFKGSNEQ